MEINTESLAVMGATLANGGVCPTTGEKVQVSTEISYHYVITSLVNLAKC